MARDDSTLPDWIPGSAREFYACTGPYSDARREQAIQGLFHAESLEDLFKYLDSLQLTYDVWACFVGCIVNAIECVPEGGAATRDAPDDKIKIREKQIRADELLSQVAKKAMDLAGLLGELSDLRAEVPSETYSSLALIESALSKNLALDDFRRFRKELSSYVKHDFPCPANLLCTLAASADAHPRASKIFSNDSWLGSQKSSWRDFMRMVAEDLSEIHAVHEVEIRLREKHWVVLVNALISPSISRSSVNAELRKLALFFGKAGEK